MILNFIYYERPNYVVCTKGWGSSPNLISYYIEYSGALEVKTYTHYYYYIKVMQILFIDFVFVELLISFYFTIQNTEYNKVQK